MMSCEGECAVEQLGIYALDQMFCDNEEAGATTFVTTL
jgi:hypothetical protein